MKKENRFRYWRIFWVVLAVYLFLIVLAFIFISLTPIFNKQFNWDKLLHLKYIANQVTGFLASTVFYYVTLNTYYKLIAGKKPFVDYIRPSLFAFIGIGIYFALTYFIFTPDKITFAINDSQFKGPLPTSVIIFSYTFEALFFIGISLLVAYLTFLRDEKKQRKILEEQKMQLEIEKSQANFNFLKAQINPHFLHNTLNFLYAKSLPFSPELSEGILTLSDIMRYALSEGNTKDGKAPLKDEIEHVRNVIKIQQLRFNNNLNVEFNVEGLINGATIIPFVLITLVENAFKHGDLKDTEHPITMRLKASNSQLYFYCRNKKKTGAKEFSTGLGLDNIKKRLDLAYSNNYRFNVKDDADFYTTELFINQL